jgi:ubiquinone/menaquinone biosynthesis C-methylase UbiE
MSSYYFWMTTKGGTMSPSRSLNEDIQQHYARSDLGTAILAALSEAGKDVNHLKPEDLAPVDEFHIRGRQATLELARTVGLDTTKQVLDVGSGVGGPSRCIAREFGCRVIGIDLTDEYCRVAMMLAERVALSHLVSYRQGDALNLPFPDETFDVAWTQHVAMNIPDKATMYREVHRVLKPGGVMAIYDILAGPAGQVLFPVPWARLPETSFLVTPDQLRQLLEESGSRSRAGKTRRPRPKNGSQVWPRTFSAAAFRRLDFTCSWAPISRSWPRIRGETLKRVA